MHPPTQTRYITSRVDKNVRIFHRLIIHISMLLRNSRLLRRNPSALLMLKYSAIGSTTSQIIVDTTSTASAAATDSLYVDIALSEKVGLVNVKHI